MMLIAMTVISQMMLRWLWELFLRWLLLVVFVKACQRLMLVGQSWMKWWLFGRLGRRCEKTDSVCCRGTVAKAPPPLTSHFHNFYNVI